MSAKYITNDQQITPFERIAKRAANRVENSLSCKDHELFVRPPVLSTNHAILKTSIAVVLRYGFLAAGRENLFADFALQVEARIVKHRKNAKGAHRTCHCHRSVISPDRQVSLLHYPDSQSGGFAGLMQCGALWVCAVCAAKITERRRADYEAAFAALDMPVVMITLKIQHKLGQSLPYLLGVILNAYRMFIVQGRPARNFRAEWSIAGWARSLETTYGGNGWHPHLHLPLVLDCRLSKWGADEFARDAARRWQQVVGACGGYASLAQGSRLSVETDRAYFVKLGFEDVDLVESGGKWSLAAELTKAPSKTPKLAGLSGMGLLGAYLVGSHTFADGTTISGKEAGNLWLHYVAAMSNQRHVVPSGVLRDKLRELKLDKLDAELVDEDRDDLAVLLGYLSTTEWKVILQHDVRGQLADVLGTGDPVLLREWLKQYDIFIEEVE